MMIWFMGILLGRLKGMVFMFSMDKVVLFIAMLLVRVLDWVLEF